MPDYINPNKLDLEKLQEDLLKVYEEAEKKDLTTDGEVDPDKVKEAKEEVIREQMRVIHEYLMNAVQGLSI